jgi:hypothetical protein
VTADGDLLAVCWLLVRDVLTAAAQDASASKTQDSHCNKFRTVTLVGLGTFRWCSPHCRSEQAWAWWQRQCSRPGRVQEIAVQVIQDVPGFVGPFLFS